MRSLISHCHVFHALKLAPRTNFKFPDQFVTRFSPLKCYLPTRTAASWSAYCTRRSSQLPLDLHAFAIQTVGIIFMTGC